MMAEIKASLGSFLDDCQDGQLQLLEKLVVQPSYSRCKEGVDRVGALITDVLSKSGMVCEVQREKEIGDQLIFRSPAWHPDHRSVLLFGHMDTVFPTDSHFNWFKDDGKRISGPGVIDMKGGLVTAIYALKSLASQGLLEKIPITFICNSDEEIGSPLSRELFQQEARRSVFAFGFECGGLGGEVVTGRKGKAGYLLTVHGKAGHAAFAGADKASAILALAHKIIALEQLNDLTKKIVVNVGVIGGGIGPNTVADTAFAEIDTRFLTLADAERTAERIAEIAEECSVAGTRGELEVTPGRLPMEQTGQNMELCGVICQEASELGLSCSGELRSGVSDANTIAEALIPVVDGMGPIGEFDHSDREYMIKHSLLERTHLTAVSIVEAWEHFSTIERIATA